MVNCTWLVLSAPIPYNLDKREAAPYHPNHYRPLTSPYLYTIYSWSTGRYQSWLDRSTSGTSLRRAWQSLLLVSPPPPSLSVCLLVSPPPPVCLLLTPPLPSVSITPTPPPCLSVCLLIPPPPPVLEYPHHPFSPQYQS